MKKPLYGRIVLLTLVVFAISPLLKVCSEVQESAEELLCDNSGVSIFRVALDLSLNALSCRISYDRPFLKDVISYLAKHENSPPVFSA